MKTLLLSLFFLSSVAHAELSVAPKVPVAAAVTHQFVTSISAGGVVGQAQPACAYLSDAATSCSTDATNASNISSGTLVTGRGGTNVTSAGSAGNRLVSNGTDWVSQASSNPDLKYNIGLSDSVGSSNWTIALKQRDGSTNCSATAPCTAAFRSSTLTNGLINVRSVTGALSQVITSGTLLGMFNSVSTSLYIYLIDSDGAGTMKLGVSRIYRDENNLQSTVAESFSTSCTQASPSVCTSTGHGMPNNTAVQLTGTISGGLTTATTYYVVSGAANTFQLSATPGGAGINKTTGGTQTPTVHINDSTLVSDAVYTSMPVRLIGKVAISESTAGTWASQATQFSTSGRIYIDPIAVRYYGSTTAVSTSSTTVLAFPTKSWDNTGSFSASTTWLAPASGTYHITCAVVGTWAAAAGNRVSLILNKNGSGTDTMVSLYITNASSGADIAGSDDVQLTQGDYISVSFSNGFTQTWTADGSTGNFLSIIRIGD